MTIINKINNIYPDIFNNLFRVDYFKMVKIKVQSLNSNSLPKNFQCVTYYAALLSTFLPLPIVKFRSFVLMIYENTSTFFRK